VRKLAALIVEDTSDDYELLLLELRRNGYDVDSARVDTAEGLCEALAARSWDIVFSDWAMPAFSAAAALAIVRETDPYLPLLIISGTVGEEAAVEALRNGARDFLVKGKLTRLAVAIERELSEANTRREQARIQEQLQISDRMASVGILAAGVAHEINNPLAAVLANLDLALADLNEPVLDLVALREELADARTAADRVRLIVRDLRVFSRTEDDKLGPVDAEGTMDSTLRMATNEIRHRARLVRDYGAIPMVHASAARLGQVFLNLVVNAAQALPDGHADRNEIRVATSVAGNRARIAISDTGPGIAPEVMKHLFTPFVTTKPKSIGTGLGLSICHRIITNFDGEILVDTGSRGTTFTVVLPLARRADSASEPAKVTLRLPVRRGRILVVDDEPIVGKAVERALGAYHDFAFRDDARQALELIRTGSRFDVIICDLMMPEMTGMDFHAQLLQLVPAQAEAIVFLTGGAFTPGAQEFLDRTANPRIEKPFDTQELRAIVNARLERT
jgi:signal transduction histidine kinase